MIAHINGTLIYKSANYVIVDAHGIGYRVFIPLSTFYELPETGDSVALNIYTHVKQDGIGLFGFFNNEEKDIFELMISVSGIGPRLAVNILSGITAGELAKAVSEGNLKRLVAVPGVGKKMAERMLLELKDKVTAHGGMGGADRAASGISEEDYQIKEDALSALSNLGYKKNMAENVIEKVTQRLGGNVSLDILLKESLRILAG